MQRTASTAGREPTSGYTALLLSGKVIASHYGDALMKLDQPILAFAIRRSLRLERQTSIPAIIWRFAFADQGVLFVGGYYAQDAH